MAKKKLGSVKRFGPRYGRKGKHKLAAIEAEQRKSHKCPYCNREKVKRAVAGVWICMKCGAKFTGKAYSPSFRSPLKEFTRSELTIEDLPQEETKVSDEDLNEDEKPKKYKESLPDESDDTDGLQDESQDGQYLNGEGSELKPDESDTADKDHSVDDEEGEDADLKGSAEESENSKKPEE